VSVLSAGRIEVGESRLEAQVTVVDLAFMRTSAVPDLVGRMLELLPGLAHHSCENDAGNPLSRELCDTETAHLLEHVVIELMALSGSPRTLHGRTSWDFARDGQGVFCVSIEYDDDIVALGALKESLGIVEWLMAGSGDPPDVDAAISRLHRLRGSVRNG
jgi:hypothetical protein